jgi:CheY-like chemotaxis protein
MTDAFDVLLLDDQREVADMLAEILAIYFPHALIRVAYTGEQAIEMAVDQRPSVAIFDLEMAGVGGEGAALALRSGVRPQPLPMMIALSGNVLRLAQLREAGPFDHLLSKPVDIATLVKLMTSQVRQG